MMKPSLETFETTPIVEAVVEISCSLPPGFDLETAQAPAAEAFSEDYPNFQRRYLLQGEISTSEASTKKITDTLIFATGDGHQLVQIRRDGFSFNRLAPYTGLDEYLPAIQDSWEKYAVITKPIQIEEIRLRYINRIKAPFENGELSLASFLETGPRLPVDRLTFSGFLNQYSALDTATGFLVETIITTDPLRENETDILPLIFDNVVISRSVIELGEWSNIDEEIRKLRKLKNDIFESTLTARCLNLYSR